MTPTFAQAVDPLFLHALSFLDRIEQNQPVDAAVEQQRILLLIDQAEAAVGASREWELAKYAIVSWIDEILVEIPWDGRLWWSNNVLEVRLFNTRLCNEQFYVRAQEASALSKRDALEVFYDCVLLGFRGMYREQSMAQPIARRLNLPTQLVDWAKQVSQSIRIGQGRPELDEPYTSLPGAPPLYTQTRVVWIWLVCLMLLICNVVFGSLVFGLFSGRE